MPAVMTPPVPDDAEALFEEARQRTRRRRQRIAACVLALTGIGAVLVALAADGRGDHATAPATIARPAGPGTGRDLLFMRVLPDDRLVRLDPRSGDVRRLPIQLSCGDTPFCLIATGQHLVISNGERTLAYTPSASKHPHTTQIGKGWITLPDQDPDVVWLGILDRHHNPRDTRLSAVREVDLDGHVLRSMRPPHGQWPVESVNDGLLFQNGNHLRLWSFATHRFTTRLPGAFPADTAGSTVASCQDPCRTYTITDLHTGSAQHIAPPAGYHWTGGYDGQFSPDASQLALPITDRALRGRADALALVDLASGTAQVIPGSHAIEPTYRAMTWSTTGHQFFFSTKTGRVRAYTSGAKRPTTIARLPGHARAMQIVAVARSD
jgi:hypothetical protein